MNKRRLSMGLGIALFAGASLAQAGNPLGLPDKGQVVKDASAGDPVAATFTGPKFSLTLRADGSGKYRGILKMGTDQVLATATGDARGLRGSYVSAGTDFEFTASISGQMMTLSTGGRTYELTSNGAAAPVIAAGDKPAAAEPAHAGPAVAGDGNAQNLGVVRATKTGRALFEVRGDARSAKALLSRTAADLAAYLHVKPTITGAFADAKDLRAMAAFTAKVEGVAIRGTILVGVGDHGGAATVVFDAADAPAKNFAALAAAIPTPVTWEDVRLPDGSGSMKLPTGWRITSAVNGAVDLVGPDGQIMGLGLAIPINTPELEQQWMQQRAAIGLPPTPSGMPVAPFPQSAVKAVQSLIPIMSKYSVAAGGASTELLKAQEVTPVQTPGGIGGFVQLTAEARNGDARVRLRSLGYVTATPIVGGHWLYYSSYASAPEGTFDAELPTMCQIWASWHVDDRVLRDRLTKAAESMRATSEIIVRGYVDRQKVVDNANADFVEVIHGYRTVEDTQTGERREADLGNVDDIVRRMNEKEGYDRYKPIPLRDQ